VAPLAAERADGRLVAPLVPRSGRLAPSPPRHHLTWPRRRWQLDVGQWGRQRNLDAASKGLAKQGRPAKAKNWKKTETNRRRFSSESAAGIVAKLKRDQPDIASRLLITEEFPRACHQFADLGRRRRCATVLVGES
jgi:hypothetical protein